MTDRAYTITTRHYTPRVCIDCGCTFDALKANKDQVRCPACQREYKREYMRRYHAGEDKATENGQQPWRLVHDPSGMEWWGDSPCFTLSEIRCTFGHEDGRKYDPMREYVFDIGCRFQHNLTGVVREVRVANGRMVLTEVTE